MKRFWITIFCVFLLGGCVSPPVSQQKPVVYVSMYVIEDFTRKIGGDSINVVSFIPPNADPHDWEPSPQDMRGLEQADLFFYHGSGFEIWAEDVIASLDSSHLQTLCISDHLDLLGEHTEHDEPLTEEDHTHGEYDPHTWLSPLNAQQALLAITETLVQADPVNARTYRQNYEIYSQKMLALDEQIAGELSSLRSRDLVVAHAAYGYLCERYGLNQIPIRSFSPETEPDPKHMAEVINYIRNHQISVIFYEINSSPDIVEAISRDTGTRYLLLNPIESVSSQQREAGMDYFSIMEQNTQAIKEGLG